MNSRKAQLNRNNSRACCLPGCLVRFVESVGYLFADPPIDSWELRLTLMRTVSRALLSVGGFENVLNASRISLNIKFIN